MIINKITTGVVIQAFDTEKKAFVSQKFVPALCFYENKNGEPVNKSPLVINGEEAGFPFDMVQPENLKWFTYVQNNSGGSFTVNDDVANYVIIQAHNADEANLIALEYGIYFGGVASGLDCSCCGDRWYMVNDDEGTNQPMIYSGVVSLDQTVLSDKYGEHPIRIHKYIVK